MNKIIYIDTETTSLSPSTGSIIELAAIFYIEDDSGKLEKHSEFHQYAMPEAGQAVSQAAIEVNGLTADRLAELEAVTQQELYDRFTRWLSGVVNRYEKRDKAIFSGWNSKFDEGFIRKLFENNNDKYYGSYFYANSVDIQSHAAWVLRNELPDMVNFKLQTVYGHIFGESEDAKFHSALYDIEKSIEIHAYISHMSETGVL